MLAIETNNLVKKYKTGVQALNNLNIQVAQGEIFSLLGPNGAGKSSLINILTTFYKPTSGRASVVGYDVCKEPEKIRANIACVAQKISIDEHLSLMENMKFQSRLYQVDDKQAKKRIQLLVGSFGLAEYLNYPVSSYSGGVKRRLDIAINMVTAPKILFLDEPTVGMDVCSRSAMWEIIKKIKVEFGTTVFLTTHYLEEADQLSDTICIMKEGKEIVEKKANELCNFRKQNIIRIGFSNPQEITKCNLGMKKCFSNSNIKGKENFLYLDVNQDTKIALNEVANWLLQNKIAFRAIELVEPTLQDVFLKLTQEGGAVK